MIKIILYYIIIIILHSSAQYVTPFTDVTQVITQPISTTPIAGHVVATAGYDLSQAQSLYSQQMIGAGADRFGGPNSLSASTRADPHTVSLSAIVCLCHYCNYALNYQSPHQRLLT